MAQDPDINQPIVAPAMSAEAGKPNVVTEPPVVDELQDVDKGYWIACLEDAERAERDWRKRGRDIIEIYRNQQANAKSGKTTLGKTTFNVLFANTEVMLPAVYQKPPEPVVKSRMIKVAAPPPMMPPGPPMMPGGMAAPPPPGVGGPPPPGPPLGGLPPPPAGPPASALPGPPAGPPGGGVAPLPPAGPMPVPPPPGGLPLPPSPAGMPMGAAPLPPMGPMPPPLPSMPKPAPGRPPQAEIETAASVMQTVLKIVVEDEHSNAAIKMAIKDVLLPGRGVCRVRWRPQMKQQPVMAGDGITPLPAPVPGGGPGAGIGDNGGPPMEDVKIWEEVGDEYVYWEDLLVDPVRAAPDMNWIAFRHLFTEKQLDQEFADSEEYQALKSAGKVDTILKWTDESAAKTPVGGGSAMKSASNLGDHIKKAMVWEIWDRTRRRIIWFVREASGIIMRVDPDSYQLEGFYPIPAPMLAITTTDTRIPRAYYDLYAKLADDLDTCCVNISKLIGQIKVRGGYNSASSEIADILTADANKMIPVQGVDMLNGGLQNHIWLVPIDLWMSALDKLLIAKEHLKSSIYEIMGISDIMRGATKASETATAQRIKGTMGVSRLEDAREAASNFVRDLMRLKAELIGQNFDAATLEAMTGEEITPAVMEILRSDFLRMCSIDIETDSTVAVDEEAEQQSMAQVMQSVQAVMTGMVPLLQTGILPPPQVVQLSLELLKMALHSIRYSRPAVELITDFQQQLQQQAMMPPPPPMMAPPGMMPPGPGGPPPGPPPQTNGAAPPGPPPIPMAA